MAAPAAVVAATAAACSSAKNPEPASHPEPPRDSASQPASCPSRRDRAASCWKLQPCRDLQSLNRLKRARSELETSPQQTKKQTRKQTRTQRSKLTNNHRTACRLLAPRRRAYIRAEPLNPSEIATLQKNTVIIN